MKYYVCRDWFFSDNSIGEVIININDEGSKAAYIVKEKVVEDGIEKFYCDPDNIPVFCEEEYGDIDELEEVHQVFFV